MYAILRRKAYLANQITGYVDANPRIDYVYGIS